MTTPTLDSYSHSTILLLIANRFLLVLLPKIRWVISFPRAFDRNAECQAQYWITFSFSYISHFSRKIHIYPFLQDHCSVFTKGTFLLYTEKNLHFYFLRYNSISTLSFSMGEAWTHFPNFFYHLKTFNPLKSSFYLYLLSWNKFGCQKWPYDCLESLFLSPFFLCVLTFSDADYTFLIGTHLGHLWASLVDFHLAPLHTSFLIPLCLSFPTTKCKL